MLYRSCYIYCNPKSIDACELYTASVVQQKPIHRCNSSFIGFDTNRCRSVVMGVRVYIRVVLLVMVGYCGNVIGSAQLTCGILKYFAQDLLLP